jgi:hypothetical protein
MNKKIAFIAFATFALPFIASAQTLQPLQNLIASINRIVGSLVPLLMALALVVFFWGLVNYVWRGGEFKENGRNVMIAGLVSLFVMASVWGIVALAQSALGVSNNVGPTIPAVPRSQ